MPDRDAIIVALVKRARDTYTANERFAKKIRSEANHGNAGRDHLYAFMRHWLSGELIRRHPSIGRQLPDDFKMGRELSAVGRWGRPYEKLRSRAAAPSPAPADPQPEDMTPHGIPGSCGHCAFWSNDPEAVRAHRETCTWREAFFQSGGMRPPYGG